MDGDRRWRNGKWVWQCGQRESGRGTVGEWVWQEEWSGKVGGAVWGGVGKRVRQGGGVGEVESYNYMIYICM